MFKCLKVNSHRHARHEKTALSVSRPRFGGVNWILDNTKLSPTENLKTEHVQSNCLIHTGTLDTTQTGPSCRVWCGVPCLCRSASDSAMRPLDALQRRTHLSCGQFTPPHQKDKTVAPACRPPPPRRTPGRQLRSRPTAHTQRRCTPRKCKHVVDCCTYG